MTAQHSFVNVDAAEQALRDQGYFANREISTAIYLADALEKPLLVEGPAGAGKTELAKATAQALGRLCRAL